MLGLQGRPGSEYANGRDVRCPDGNVYWLVGEGRVDFGVFVGGEICDDDSHLLDNSTRQCLTGPPALVTDSPTWRIFGVSLVPKEQTAWRSGV